MDDTGRSIGPASIFPSKPAEVKPRMVCLPTRSHCARLLVPLSRVRGSTFKVPAGGNRHLTPDLSTKRPLTPALSPKGEREGGVPVGALSGGSTVCHRPLFL